MYANSAYTPYLPSLLEPLASSEGVLQAWPLRHYKLLWLGHNLSGCNDHLGRELRRDLVEGEGDVSAGSCWLARMKPIHCGLSWSDRSNEVLW